MPRTCPTSPSLEPPRSFSLRSSRCRVSREPNCRGNSGHLRPPLCSDKLRSRPLASHRLGGVWQRSSCHSWPGASAAGALVCVCLFACECVCVCVCVCACVRVLCDVCASVCVLCAWQASKARLQAVQSQCQVAALPADQHAGASIGLLCPMRMARQQQRTWKRRRRP